MINVSSSAIFLHLQYASITIGQTFFSTLAFCILKHSFSTLSQSTLFNPPPLQWWSDVMKVPGWLSKPLISADDLNISLIQRPKDSILTESIWNAVFGFNCRALERSVVFLPCTRHFSPPFSPSHYPFNQTLIISYHDQTDKHPRLCFLTLLYFSPALVLPALLSSLTHIQCPSCPTQLQLCCICILCCYTCGSLCISYSSIGI